MKQAELNPLQVLVSRYQQNDVIEVESLRCDEFITQNNAIDDQSTLKAYNTTRRGGKSSAIAIEFCESAIEHDETNYLYIALTVGSAREIIWDMLKEMVVKDGYDGKPNETRLEIVFRNKSKIKLAGADCSEKQMRKILGQKYKKVAIDEAGSFTIDMKKLVYQMILPTLVDHNGKLILLGTCENIPLTFFESVTEGIEKGWSVHKWTAYDNPFVKENWHTQIEMLETNNPNVRKTSWFRTHYLNEWCSDDDLLIFKIFQHNYIEELPKKRTEYDFIMGVDLGYNDASAFAVLAYHQYDHKCYLIKSFKHTELNFTKVRQVIEKVTQAYPINRIIIDGANKQGVEELRLRFKKHLKGSEKQGKAIYLKLLADDLIEGNFVMVEKDNDQLIGEWKQLQWSDEHKIEEDSRCQNHISDAVLYGWRECRHYMSDEENIPPDKDTDQWADQQEQIEAEQWEQQRNNRE